MQTRILSPALRALRSAMPVLLLAFAAVPSEAQTRIEWKLAEGDQFYLETTIAFKQTQKIAGQEVSKQDYEVTTLNRYKVLKKNPDDGWLVERLIESVKLKNPQSAGQTGAILQQFQGCTFRITFASNLRVLKQEGYEELIKKLGGQDPVAGRMARATVPENGLKEELEETFAFMPDKPVQVGDKWDRRYLRSLGASGSLLIVRAFQYEGTVMEAGKKVEKLLATPVVTHSATKPTGQALQFPTDGKLKAENTRGQLLFDAAAGRLVLSELSFRLRGSLSTTVNNQNFDLDVDMEQSVRVRGVDPKQ